MHHAEVDDIRNTIFRDEAHAVWVERLGRKRLQREFLCVVRLVDPRLALRFKLLTIDVPLFRGEGPDRTKIIPVSSDNIQAICQHRKRSMKYNLLQGPFGEEVEVIAMPGSVLVIVKDCEMGNKDRSYLVVALPVSAPSHIML